MKSLPDVGKLNRRSDAISRTASEARGAFAALRNIRDKRANDAIQSAGDGRGYRQAVALLSGSGLNEASLRSQVHARILKISDTRRSGRIETSGGSSGRDQPSSDVPGPSADVDAPKWLIDGWHPWVYWLQRVHRSSDDPNEERNIASTQSTLIDQGQQIRSTLQRLQQEKFDEIGLRPEQHAAKGKMLAEGSQ